MPLAVMVALNLVALWSGAAPAWAQQRVSPSPAWVAQVPKPSPRPASPALLDNPLSTAPDPAKRSTGGCSLSIDQMQRVARGQVLRLGQGDCQMLFNTIR